METEQKPKDWTDKQKKAFVKIQNQVYSKLGLSNQEVAEMHTLTSKENVFALFQFQTGKWISELKLKVA